MQPSDRYALAGPLRWCEFDGEWVVFCTATGALRCTDQPTAAVLATLEEAPATAAAVAARIVAATEVAVSDEMMVGLVDLLDELQRTGFLERETR